MVYARCSALERLELFEELQAGEPFDNMPWIVEGDFNIILNDDEKLGGLPFLQQEAIKFAFFVSSCSFVEVKFTGSNYTWWNDRIEEE